MNDLDNKHVSYRRRIKHVIKYALNLEAPGREVVVREDDTFLVSFPKSGNTWTRFLVGNLISPTEPVTFANIERIIPDIYQNRQRALSSRPSPRILKSHEPFDPRYRKVIYIIRDPRDVLVSYYHHAVKFREIEVDFPIENFFQRFIRTGWGSFGTWYENVSSWIATRGRDKNFLLVKYEALQQRPLRELSRIADFLELKTDENGLDGAIKRSSADEMRKLERIGAKLWQPTKGSDHSKPFVRKAKAGSWREELPTEFAKMMLEEWSDVMSQFDYGD